MKKLFAIAMIWFCGHAMAQTNPAQPATTQGAANTPPAAPAANTPPTSAMPTTSGVVGGANAVYTDRIPPEQIITLDANSDKFQARHIPDLSGLPRGAVIVLHDSGQHPNWPFTAAALIDDLPLHGWDTLNIELPAPLIAAETVKETSTPAAQAVTPAPTPAQPATPAANNPASANTTAPAATATPTIAVEPQTQARISAAIKYFTDQNQRNIALIGFGSGAIRAAENLRVIAAANTTTPGDTTPLTALVIIAPLQQLPGIDLDLPKLLPLTGISALDMTLDSDPQARAEAEARRRAVLHQRTRTYTRLELPPINNMSDAQHSGMVKRVRSWLQKNANEIKTPEKPADQKPTAR